MKKFFTILALAATSFLASCDNENSENPQPLGKAIITGTVSTEFDYTNTTEEPVANKKIIIGISEPGSGTQNFTETTTDANGNYSIEVKIGNEPLEVSLWLVDFKQTVKYDVDTEEEETFYGQDFFAEVVVVKGGEFIVDLNN